MTTPRNITRNFTWAFRALCLTCATVMIVLVGSAASAQEYPVQTGSMTLEEDTGAPAGESDAPAVKDTGVFVGQALRISAGGFEPGSEVVITIESEPIVVMTTIADANGEIDVSFVLPEEVPEGAHTIKASGDSAQGGRLVLAQPVEVATEAAVRSGVASATASAPPGATGSSTDSRNILIISLAGVSLLLVLGKLLWSRSRRELDTVVS